MLSKMYVETLFQYVGKKFEYFCAMLKNGGIDLRVALLTKDDVKFVLEKVRAGDFIYKSFHGRLETSLIVDESSSSYLLLLIIVALLYWNFVLVPNKILYPWILIDILICICDSNMIQTS